jgi:hypothetical protein
VSERSRMCVAGANDRDEGAGEPDRPPHRPSVVLELGPGVLVGRVSMSLNHDRELFPTGNAPSASAGHTVGTARSSPAIRARRRARQPTYIGVRRR